MTRQAPDEEAEAAVEVEAADAEQEWLQGLAGP